MLPPPGHPLKSRAASLCTCLHTQNIHKRQRLKMDLPFNNSLAFTREVPALLVLPARPPPIPVPIG